MKLGRIKFRFERLRSYLGWIQALMIVDMWIQTHGFGWWVVPCLGIIGLLIHWIDKNWVYPGESSAGFENNPEWSELSKKIDEIKNRLA